MIVWALKKKDIERYCSKEMAFAVTKDHERVLIGGRQQILSRLAGDVSACVDYDEVQPFGTFLLSDGYAADPTWEEAVSLLEEAQRIFLSPKLKQSVMERPQKYERAAQKILNKKCAKGDPVSCYVAMRIWYEYWKIRGKESAEKSKEFLAFARNLIRPLLVGKPIEAGPDRVNAKHPVFHKAKDEYMDDRTRIVFSSLEGYDECIFISSSLIPLERFYETKVEKWTKYIIECKVCKRLFMADSLQYEMCSEECKKQSQAQTRDRRKEDPATAEVDKMLAATDAHWDRRLANMKKSPEWSVEEVSKYENARKIFREEKRKRRKLYKCGDISFRELQGWLCEQQNRAERLLQKMREEKGR